MGFVLLLPVQAAGQAVFVQVNSNTALAYTNTTAVPLASPQTAGNLSIVVVGWSDTSSTVASVTDSNGKPDRADRGELERSHHWLGRRHGDGSVGYGYR